jgi:hypothetical protein
MRTKRKMRYQKPSARFDIDYEMERSILASSRIDVIIKVDPLEEHYFEATDPETSDYLIEF